MDGMDGMLSVTGGRVAHRVREGGPGTPLLVLHGGPGLPSLPLDGVDLGDLLQDRRVVEYDQLGSGLSERPDDVSLWTLPRFVEEVAQVREALALPEVHLLAHSWGTLLAVSYLLEQPAGVRSAVLSSPCLDARAWERDQRDLLTGLSVEHQRAVEECEASGETGSPRYLAAMDEYYHRHVCRLDPWPAEVDQMFEDVNEQVYGTMWGASEFTVTGTLHDADVTSRLPELDLPVMLVAGEHDEARPATVRRQADLVRGARYLEIAGTSHLPQLERPEAYWPEVRRFLAASD